MRKAEIGLVLPAPPAPIANILAARQVGEFLYLAGQGPRDANGLPATGKVGGAVSGEQAYRHTRLTGLNLLAVAQAVLGSLDRVVLVVKLLAMVNAVDGFVNHPRVIDGYSDLLVEVFGEHIGRGARSSIGVHSLPDDQTVEIKAIFAIESSSRPAVRQGHIRCPRSLWSTTCPSGFFARGGVGRAIVGLWLTVRAGEVLGIVGESGSGKSVTALSILGLLPDPPGRIAAGSIRFDGREIVGMSKKELRALRGPSIGMIFQEPMTSLNPVFRIGDQIIETIRAHESIGRSGARKRAIGLLDRVGIASPERRLDDYPHQLSGGMRQRVMIAIALACSPRLLLADEPTTALDVTIQAQLLDLLRDIQKDTGMAVVIITHNMGVIAEFADRVLVMYAGRVAEQGPVDAVFTTPRHPYTLGLLGSTPSLERDEARLTTIPGVLPQLTEVLPGCRFAPRCGRRTEVCVGSKPPLSDAGHGQHAACFHWDAQAPGAAP